MRHVQQYNGDLMPLSRRMRVSCCHCGLVHDFQFVTRKGIWHLRPHVNKRSTAALRRHRFPHLRRVGLR